MVYVGGDLFGMSASGASLVRSQSPTHGARFFERCPTTFRVTGALHLIPSSTRSMDKKKVAMTLVGDGDLKTSVVA